MRRSIFFLAIAAAGCGTVPAAEEPRWAMPVEVVQRSLCTVAVVARDTAIGTAMGALEGLVQVGRSGYSCVEPACVPFVIVVSTGGALMGGIYGLSKGFARSESNCN